jgi:membrane carboxypeptidase/penicillin-binding protein PbpC
MPLSFLVSARSSIGPITMPPQERQRIISPEAAYMIVHILTDRNARLNAFPDLRAVIFPFDIAVKTGTSKNFRDAWAVGCTHEYIVGIWIGDVRGGGMEHVSGGGGALPVLYDAFLALNKQCTPTEFAVANSIERIPVFGERTCDERQLPAVEGGALHARPHALALHLPY